MKWLVPDALSVWLSYRAPVVKCVWCLFYTRCRWYDEYKVEKIIDGGRWCFRLKHAFNRAWSLDTNTELWEQNPMWMYHFVRSVLCSYSSIWHMTWATRIPTCVTRLITANDSGINGRITRKPKSHDIRAICRRSFAIRLTVGIALRVHIISALTLFTVWINRCDFCVADISTKLMLNSMIDDFENVVMSVSLSYHILRGGGHNECVNIVLTSAVDHHLTRALTDISAYAMHIRVDWYIFAVSDALPTRWAHIITYAP